ncbi:Methyltransferase-like protein 4 [Operophtera brumata]|uniref:Methyltransferase-like protein 4 n=1 Tax=Operophtera brumata TaxID=104452 RepID=A0A0L7KKI6_OPEBR|nr:Methyltransferase-like protein 4 [Operophtera brumata]
MSVILQKNNYSFMDHGDFIKKLYKDVSENENITSYKLSGKLFSIINENKKKPNRKRCHESDSLHAETLAVRQMYQEFFLDIPTGLKANLSITKTLSNTSSVRDFAQKLLESTTFDHAGLNGGNSSDESLRCKVMDEYFFIPPKSSFIDHGDFIKKLYKDVSKNENITSYKLSGKLFSIINENKKKPNRKRCHESDSLHAETLAVRQMYQEFFLDIPTGLKANLSIAKTLSNTSSVRDFAQKLLESTTFDHAGLNGGNSSDESLMCKVMDEYFFIPPKSRFFCGCVKEQCRKLSGSKFDILIADPPWWNKYIRRLKNANEKLSNIEDVKNIIFPQWGVTYITTWYWLKVSVDLEPICPFGSGHKKQPYERLILGRVGDVDVPESQLIVTVPNLLCPYVKVESPQTLELFARYLLPNTTSIGYEPLKWQHISLYEQITCEENKAR